MAKPIISFAREFVIFGYRIGHGQLLLRSAKKPGNPTRIEILFKDVRAMELRCDFNTITIEEASLDDISNLMTNPSDTIKSAHKIYLIRSLGWTGCVIAGSVFWQEDEGEFAEPSGFDFE